ncbi:MAG TPA: hypothetical protein VG319_08375, partial [Polyangia bacterium]|nr:hypothetical protein [Polyangia bacterium]
LDLWASGGPPPDDARAIEGTHLDLEGILAGFEPAPSGADATVLWRDDTRPVLNALERALRDTGWQRRAALAALDGRLDGPGLAPLVAGAATPVVPATAAAVAAIAAATRDAVAARLDDGEVGVRAAALRVLAKSDDPRVTLHRLVRAAAGGPEEREAAAAVARRWAQTSPSAARALAEALTSAFAAQPASSGDEAWQARLGIVRALAATGGPSVTGLHRALGDPNLLVRAAAAAALAVPTEPNGAHP